MEADFESLSDEDMVKVEKAIEAIMLNSWKMPHATDPFSNIPLDYGKNEECKGEQPNEQDVHLHMQQMRKGHR